MIGYIMLIDKIKTEVYDKVTYVKNLVEGKDGSWRLEGTHCMNKALFLDEMEKEVFENILVVYDRIDDIYFVEVERNTGIANFE